MPWIKLDDHFDEHPKVAAAGPLAIALWVSALAYCNRNLTDGFVPTSVAQRLIDCRGLKLVNHPKVNEFEEPDPWYFTVLTIEELVAVGLFDEVPNGYHIHDYEDFQPTKAAVMAERAQKQAAGRAGGQASAQARAQAETQASAQAQSKPVPVPVPVPSVSNETLSQSAREPLSIPVKGMNGTTTDVPISAVQPPVDVIELQRLAEELTGTAYVMANVFSGYGSKAVEEQLIPHGLERVARAWRQISAQVTANGTSKPTLRQLVLGADDILNPIPSSKEINAVDKAAEEERRRKRREELSQKQLAYLREGENR